MNKRQQRNAFQRVVSIAVLGFVAAVSPYPLVGFIALILLVISRNPCT